MVDTEDTAALGRTGGSSAGWSPLPRWTVPVVAVVVLGATVLVLVALWRWIDGLALADAEKKAAAQLDAVKVAASIAVGSGGLFALYLAARRQRTQELELAQRESAQAHTQRVDEQNRRHAERVAADARADAEARRVTELYAKSVEQLGSDKAPVRLGGLYALERLAQDNEHQRQTIVNVLCAYLRMPYQLLDPSPANDTDRPIRDAQLQEREVRLTAQRLLTSHLQSNSSAFWDDIALDLTGATLIDFVMIKGAPRWVSFKSTNFAGDAIFIQTDFPEYVNFEDTTFGGDAHFVEVTFNGDARFQDTTFKGNASFGGLMKSEVVNFAKAAKFNGATFNRNASFAAATFTGPAYFGQALRDESTTFVGNASFLGARFKNSADFRGTTFADKAEFKDASFIAKAPSLVPEWGATTTDFRSATFAKGTPSEVMKFTDSQLDKMFRRTQGYGK